MSNYTRLYGDNGECFGEIDQDTLKREWDYLNQFPGIFSPASPRSARDEDPKQEQPVRKAPHLRLV